MRRDDRGFSLVELMAVITIIGVLVALVLPSLLGFRSRSMDTKIQAGLTAVARGQAGLEPLQNGFTDDLVELEAMFPELEFGAGEPDHIRAVVGDVVVGDSGQVLLYARSDSGTWFGIKLVATGADIGRHTCSGAEADMTLVDCVGETW